MSLINDVLKQVDRKPSGRASLLTIRSLPNTVDDSNSKVPSVLFLAVLFLLSMAIIFQILSGKSIAFLFNSQADVIENQEKSMIVDVLNGHNTEEVIDIHDDVVISTMPVARGYEESNENQTENKKEVKVKLGFVENQKDQSYPVESLVEVTQDEANYYYQKSLLSLNSGRVKNSENLINNAINLRADIKYLVLKARVLIELKKPKQFYDHIIKYSHLRNSEWLKIAAPGLQIFSFNQLSNTFYYFLIELEPRNIQWKLALALNFLRLNEPNKALAIYQALTKTEGVSQQQLVWLNRKIRQLNGVGR